MRTIKINKKGDFMTEKLYENEPYRRDFKADLKNIEKKDGQYHVELSQTYFYPEGGGQPSDKGEIDGIKVDYVYKNEDKVFHVLDNKPKGETDLNCKIDWERRYDFMQQHTGQHLLSAVFKNEHDLNTVGFTLSEESLRIDLDKKINDQEIKAVEEKINEYIYENIKVETLYPDNKTINEFDLRKEPTVDENIRVIKIGELDFSPCGGTHLKSTGELGIIKITNIDNYKGGLRIDFVCGKRALKDYDFKNKLITELRDITSVPDENIVKEVKRLKKELKNDEDKITELNKKLLKYQADELIKQAESVNEINLVYKVFSEITYDNVQWLSDIITKKENNICIFGQHDESTARLLLSKSDNIKELDMNEIINNPLEIIGGRGGGNPQKAQGGGSKVNKIEEAINQALKIIRNKV
jgi:alanyl-tRNA synthetase